MDPERIPTCIKHFFIYKSQHSTQQCLSLIVWPTFIVHFSIFIQGYSNPPVATLHNRFNILTDTFNSEHRRICLSNKEAVN